VWLGLAWLGLAWRELLAPFPPPQCKVDDYPLKAEIDDKYVSFLSYFLHNKVNVKKQKK
jgi:hypothetical protein